MRRILGSKVTLYVVLSLGALAFLFPFYYMLVGSLQTKVDPTLAGAFPNPANLTLENYVAINDRINLLQGLVNSGIFAGGVLLGTVVFGVLAGYALAVLHWRGRGTTFALALLVQVVPFQLLMIPLYVMIARDYGLSDRFPPERFAPTVGAAVDDVTGTLRTDIEGTKWDDADDGPDGGPPGGGGTAPGR